MWQEMHCACLFRLQQWAFRQDGRHATFSDLLVLTHLRRVSLNVKGIFNLGFDTKIFKEIIAKRSAETAYKTKCHSGKYRNRNVGDSVMEINGAFFINTQAFLIPCFQSKCCLCRSKNPHFRQADSVSKRPQMRAFRRNKMSLAKKCH